MRTIFLFAELIREHRRNFDTEKKILFIEVEFLLSVMGMGGEEFGEKASLISVEELNNFKEKDFNEYHEKYFDMVNSRICDLRFENNGVKSGTTIALIYIKVKKATALTGDSRTYL